MSGKIGREGELSAVGDIGMGGEKRWGAAQMKRDAARRVEGTLSRSTREREEEQVAGETPPRTGMRAATTLWGRNNDLCAARLPMPPGPFDFAQNGHGPGEDERGGYRGAGGVVVSFGHG